MATVPYGEGVPSIAPEVRTPDDYQHVQTSPEAFGGGVAKGEQQFGQGASKSGQFFGEVAADNASNQFQDEATKLLHGDPSKTVMGPDGQPQQDLGYLGLRGDAALRARPAVEAQMDDTLKNIRGGLQTPDQELRFDEFSRRYRSYIAGQIGTHADNQAMSWYGEVNKASGDLALGHISANAFDDDEVKHGTADLMRSRIKQAQLMGGGDTLVTEALASSRRDAVKAQVDAIAPTDPIRAKSVLDNNKDAAGAFYQPLAAQLKTQVAKKTAYSVVNQSSQDTLFDLSKPDVTNGLHDIFMQQESGNQGPNPGQIQPGTFQQFAQPGETYGDPNAMRATAYRAIDSYAQRYQGDLSRVAVAYFSGPGNVAPITSPTPWIRDAADSNGKTTSSYVQDIAGRAGGNAGSFKAGTYQRILDATRDDPEVRQDALREFNERYTASQIAAEQDTKGRKDARDQAAQGYINRAVGGKVQNIIQDIGRDPTLDWETKARLPEVIEKFMSDPNRAQTKYGDGFWDAYKQATASVGDPTRITDQGQVLRMAVPDANGNAPLNLSGVAALTPLIQKMQKSPQGEADIKLQRLFFDAAEEQISHNNPIKGIKDTKGKTAFLQYMQYALPSMESGLEQGKSMAEMTDLKGPIAQSIAHYVRKPAQVLADMAAEAKAEREALTGAKAAPDKPRTLDDIIGDVNSGRLDPEAGQTEAQKLGFIRAAAPVSPTAPESPMAPMQ